MPVSRETPDPAENPEVIKRVNRMRGVYLAQSGRDISWTEIGRSLGWASATISDVSSGRRALRVVEIAAIARVLDCSPGWLAFGEGVMRWTPDTPGVETEQDDDPRSPVVAHPLPKRLPAATPSQRPAKRAGGKGGR